MPVQQFSDEARTCNAAGDVTAFVHTRLCFLRLRVPLVIRLYFRGMGIDGLPIASD